MSDAGKKKLIYPLAGIVLVIVIGLGVYMYINQRLSSPVTLENVDVDSDAVMKLGLMNQVSKKNGVTEWELKASSATLLKSENKAVLEDPDVVFFTKDGTSVHLTSGHGILGIKSHDLTFSKNVIIYYKTFTLTSDKLQYDKKTHIIHSDSRVLLEDRVSRIEADSMVTELNRNRVVLNGHVKGTFSEKFNLP